MNGEGKTPLPSGRGAITYSGYEAACEYWAEVRATPGFAEQAAGRNIKLPPQPSAEERALALLKGALKSNPALADVIVALEAASRR